MWRASVCALLALSVLALWGQADGARILAAAPMASASHFRLFQPLLRELAARGHQVTVISHYPQQQSIPNYTDISLVAPGVTPLATKPFLAMKEATVMSVLRGWYEVSGKLKSYCREAYRNPRVRQLLLSDAQFDLALVEVFAGDCMAGLAHRFNAPLVGYATAVPLPWAYDRMGNPDHPAYMENFFLPMVAPFDFWERTANTVFYLFMRLFYWLVSERPVDAIEREALGDSAPPTSQLVFNTSLMLLNSHFSINQPVPLVPAMIEVAGLHIRQPTSMPKELQEWVDSSKQGVIYFSMGTLVRCDSLPQEQLQGIIRVFASLPQRILWKVDARTLPPLPPNVYTSSWLPQNDILNHPNVVAFISHGGLLGLQEAVSAGVPMLLVPVLGDQLHNAVSMKRRGVAEVLTAPQLTEHNLRTALDRLVNDTSYRKRMKQLSVLFRDRPRPPLEEAVHWVEYVIRHKGAPHLRSAALDLSWYQYLLLDVAAFVLAMIVLAVALAYIVVTRTLRLLFASRTTQKKKIKSN